MLSYACLPTLPLMLGDYSLNDLQPAHIEDIRQWRNAQMAVLRQREPISPAQQRQYFETQVWPILALPHPPQILRALCHQGRLIGYGGLVHIAWPHRRAEVSFLLDPQRTREEAGYAADFSAFLTMLKTMAFGPLALQRLWTETYATRDRHVAVLEANGFEPEGRLRRHVIHDGLAVDSLLHGCLSPHAN